MALLVLLTACQAGGLEIIVYPPADPGAKKIDEIRVYTGIGAGEMTRMGTAAFAPDRLRRGGRWLRDIDADALAYQSKKLGSDTESAAFVFSAREEGEQLSVIALGLTNGEVTSAIGTYELDVPTDYVAVYRVGLNAAGPAKPTSTAMTQVELWGEPNAQTCVQLVDRGGYSDPKYPIAFITTPNDADCDGFAADAPEECDDHFYRGFVKPSTGSLTCLVDDAVGSPGPVPACRVGGPICVDGTPANTHTKCSVQHPYCAPTDLCTRCGDDKYADPFSECAIDPLAHDPGALGSRYVCKIPVGKNQAGNIALCPHHLAIPLAFTLPTVTCTNPMFHGPKKDDSWRARIDVANGTYTLASAGTAGQCNITATPTKLPDDLALLPFGGLFSLDVTPERGIVGSIVLEKLDTGLSVCPTQTVTVTCQELNANTVDVGQCLERAPSTGG